MSIEFNKLITGNDDTLKLFAIKLTRDNEDAKDLLQETLYKALTYKEKINFDANTKFRLLAIMRNIFVNDYRREVNQHEVFDYSENDSLSNTQLSVVNIAESRLKIQEIQASIYHLPAVFRNPFLLHFEGYKYREIASMLREPLGTVKGRIHFARKLLKAKISRYN